MDSNLPNTTIEVHILAILINRSYIAKDIEFIGGTSEPYKRRRYLRVGYWQRLPDEAYAEIKEFVTEELVDDDPEKLPEFAYFLNNQ